MQNTPQRIVIAVIAGLAFAGPASAETAQPSPAPHHARHHVQIARAKPAIAPLTRPRPIPAATDGETNAPIPNEWITAPIERQDPDTSIAPAVMQIHYPPMGDGYTLGSSAQAMDDREAAKVTGVLIETPIGQ